MGIDGNLNQLSIFLELMFCTVKNECFGGFILWWCERTVGSLHARLWQIDDCVICLVLRNFVWELVQIWVTIHHSHRVYLPSVPHVVSHASLLQYLTTIIVTQDAPQYFNTSILHKRQNRNMHASLLHYFNTSILQYFNTSILIHTYIIHTYMLHYFYQIVIVESCVLSKKKSSFLFQS